MQCALYTYLSNSVDIKLCSSAYTGQGAGFSVSGRIESGFLQQGDNVLVLPANECATVKGVLSISISEVFLKYFQLC